MTFPIAQNQPGPLPLKLPFNTPISGDVTIAFSGTCWSKFAGSICGVSVYLDGNKLGDVPLCFNNTSMHLALPTHVFSANMDFGQHTIMLAPLTDETNSDKNDFYSVWIVD
ncbi:MAG: hypothetical protein BGP24_01890 [Lysobacterales bacterium 69-70]|nr:hypothetical protein [Xanthomonadaceae bacterium]ODU31683.1 MAG: hypothetical protein ABS97_19140 [Xanthomonadaceae bacterium SCN 69-320]ODV16251.1 MAG: hypothetical protein ABT27_20585 [Xanthomonadaceae bacterium SCN 69-25]OJZ01527.1 MAG: hypothetical protein BGP24_01890 [Xanthomonadales bacterium 69-70]